jgi:hypothetical protein
MLKHSMTCRKQQTLKTGGNALNGKLSENSPENRFVNLMAEKHWRMIVPFCA